MRRSPVRDPGRDAKLREDIKQYRRTLQKISKVKTKILIALRDEGCPEASHMLQSPPSQTRAPRCQECGGCRIRVRLGPCLNCLDCRAEEDCMEHTRLCFVWRQPATTFVMGSTVTGVSSICNAAEYELDKYKDLIEKLGEASLEVDATLDQFPAGSAEHANDRFNQERRERDLRCEDEQLVLIETLLSRYQEERVRLRDVHSDEEDGDVDDAVEVDGGPPGGFRTNVTDRNSLHVWPPPSPGRIRPGPRTGLTTTGLGWALVMPAYSTSACWSDWKPEQGWRLQWYHSLEVPQPGPVPRR